MDFSKKLIRWYNSNQRSLPWRGTKDPYKIWLSEIILQQTRVAQGLPYYEKFIENFPTVFHLAKADEQTVLKLWQGLGYYSRARNLHQTAQQIAADYNGRFPTNFLGLQQLKGVGTYTAAAIASLAFDEDVVVLDGNVYRVMARYFAVELDIAAHSSKKYFFELAQSQLPKGKAAVFNQALMEFGATHCTPQNPKCESCIFSNSCAALQKKIVDKLPLKLKKTKVTQRFLHYIIPIDCNQNTTLNKRTNKGIWQNLYEFPLVETLEKTTTIDAEIQTLFPQQNIEKPILKATITHKLSHQNLEIYFWELQLQEALPEALSFEEVKKRPFPIVIYNFLSENYFCK